MVLHERRIADFRAATTPYAQAEALDAATAALAEAMSFAPTPEQQDELERSRVRLHASALARRGWWRRRGRGGAIGFLGQALATYPDDVLALWGSGAVRAAHHDRAGAAADLERASQIAADQGLGDLYVRIRADRDRLRRGQLIGQVVWTALPKLALFALHG